MTDHEPTNETSYFENIALSYLKPHFRNSWKICFVIYDMKH